jgi:high-affinity K+ transport system ATPase subunit B
MATPTRLADPATVRGAVVSAVHKLDPRVQVRNPVMFVVLVASVLVTLRFAVNLAAGGGPGGVSFTGQVALWLWCTVLLANLAEAMAEGRGKARADSLRRTRGDATARRMRAGGGVEVVPASQLRPGDQVVVDAGEVVPGDGEVVEGTAPVDESAVTGESVPLVRAAGGDRSAVTAGTRVLSGRLRIRITAGPGQSLLDRMAALLEGAGRHRTPNELALSALLSALTVIFLVAVATAAPFVVRAGRRPEVVTLVALAVSLIPTTIGALLPAIGIAAMDRMVRRNVLAASVRAVEAAGGVDTLLVDRTGRQVGEGGAGVPGDHFDRLRRMGIRTVLATADNPLTAAAVASEAGVDDFLAQATPERKLELIRAEQAGGRVIAVTGHGTGDAPTLAQADVGVAMRSGAVAAREAADMVDLDSNPAKLTEIVEIGKQVLVTRGSLTVFSVATDLAKCLAVVPALFAATWPVLDRLDVLGLASPRSAVLSAVIFNALVIAALIPLALRGVRLRPVPATALLRRNLLVYGVGGLLVAFAGIKLADLAVNLLHLT